MEVIVQKKNKISSLRRDDALSKKQKTLVLCSIPKSGTYQQLKEMIQDEEKLMLIAFCFRINPSPLRKILANKIPSKYILSKLHTVQAELSQETDLNDFLFKSPRGQKLISIYHLYQKEGSLERVGRFMNLSREGVRQLLNKGTKLGLFEYKKFNLERLADLSKEKILGDYKRRLSLKKVANLNDISMNQLSRRLDQYKVTSQELYTIRIEGRRMYCINQYKLLVKKLGGHPSTSEMEKTSDGLSLFNKIIRLWGSIQAFRKDLNISFSPRSSVTRRSLVSF